MSALLFSNPDLVLLEIPGTGAERLLQGLDAPVETRRISHLPARAPRAAVIRHPYMRFLSVFSDFSEPSDGEAPRIAGLTMDDAINFLETSQVPFDCSRNYPQAELKHALMAMTHPVHKLHEADHILRAETLEKDWSDLGITNAAPMADTPLADHELPAEIEKKLHKIYVQDFNILGYNPEDLHPVSAPKKPSSPNGPDVWDLWPALFEGISLQQDRAKEALPAPDVPLEPFLNALVGGRRGRTWTGRDTDLTSHFRRLQPEFADASRLAHLLAACVVVLRRAPDCAEAHTLFQRILHNHAQVAAKQLKLRWLASVTDTLADHGTTQGQRALGIAGSLLANTLKLTETERRVYGPSRPWPPKVRWSKGGPLFDGMITYWVEKGEMIGKMRARLERVASDDPIAGPVIVEIMERAHRHDTVYRRFAEMAGQPSPPVMDRELQADLRALLRDAL